MNNTLKPSSVGKKRKRSLSPATANNVTIGKTGNATHLSIKSGTKQQKSEKLRLHRKKKSSDGNMQYTTGVQVQSNIPPINPINPMLIYSKYYGSNQAVEKKTRGLFFKKDEKN